MKDTFRTLPTDPVLRILDANFNRAREGLRTVEDALRFAFRNAALCRDLKRLRHRLSGILTPALPAARLKGARDSRGDIGKDTDSFRKLPAREIMERNLSRVGEALRSMEEFSRALNPGLSRKLHRLRFDFYETEKTVLLRASRRRIPLPCLYVILDIERTGNVLRLGENVLSGGPDVIQLRCQGTDTARFLSAARCLRRIIPDRVPFLINDRIDVCLLSDADGVHLQARGIPPTHARRLLPDRIVGLSCRDLRDIERARDPDIDYIAVAPDFLTAARKKTTIPLIGISGITAGNIADILRHGADGAAVIFSGSDSPAPGRTICKLREEVLRHGRTETRIPST